MINLPKRCEHIKVNGTQCGSPALRRNRLCYFHQRHHEEQIALNLDRDEKAKADKVKNTRSGKATLALPVLEDANSIQVSLMQIMRLLIAGQIDAKIAGLLLYALQTASINLRQTRFEPSRNQIILDPAAVSETPLGAYQLWSDEDFEDENDEENEEEEEDPDDEEAESKDAAQPSPDETAAQARKKISEEILKGFPAVALEQAARERQKSG